MGEFLETTYDKFVFKVKTGLFYSRDDFWVEIRNAHAIIGVSDFLQKARGDVAFLETLDAGTPVKQGEEAGKIETIKATFGIMSPVTGTIVEVNPELEGSSFLINEDPYGAGWIYRIQPTDWENERSILLQPEAYMELMQEKITKEMQKK